MSSTTLMSQVKGASKSLAQTALEWATGRDLDPVRVSYSSRSEPVGKGYYQTVVVRSETNLRTKKTITTEERGAIV